MKADDELLAELERISCLDDDADYDNVSCLQLEDVIRAIKRERFLLPEESLK